MNRVDVALVRGPAPRGSIEAAMPVPPLGLLYVAAALEVGGFRAAVVDAPGEGLNRAGVVQRLRMLRPAVIGLTGMTPMRDRISREVDLVRPLCDRVVLGGVHASAAGRAALDEFPLVDALVIGEAEQSAAGLLGWWAGGGDGDPPPGVMVRDRPFAEAPAPVDLDGLPWPARHLLTGTRYRYPFQTRPGFTTALTSRGCPFRCTFCDRTVGGTRWRPRSAGSVVDEIQHLSRDLGVGSLCIFDDNFTLDRHRVERICEGIRSRGIDIHWKCEARVDGLTPELALSMAAAGCRTVALGIESASQASLDRLQKGQTVAQARAAIGACRRAGMETIGYLLVGIPGETPADALRGLRFARREGLDWVQFSTLAPYEGTPLHAQALRDGQLALTSVRSPADAEPERAAILSGQWRERDLARTLRLLYGGFYLRPGWMLRQAGRALATGSLVPRARLGFKMLRWMGRLGG